MKRTAVLSSPVKLQFTNEFSADKRSIFGNDMTLADIIPAEVDSPDEVTVNEEFVNRISKGMDKLSASHREILVLRNVKNLSYEEIGGILGISVGTVKSRIARARESLRAKLGEDFK